MISSEPPPSTHTFDADKFYQSAASQLDILLPTLTPTSLPATTALRTITLRIQTPPADSHWINEFKRSGIVEGRAVLKKAFRTWASGVNSKKGEEAVFKAIDAIMGRVAIEGFVVLEEWWDLRRGLCMLTVRC